MRQGKTLFPFFCIGDNRWLSRLGVKNLSLHLGISPVGFHLQAVGKRNRYHEVYTCLSLLHKYTRKNSVFQPPQENIGESLFHLSPNSKQPKSSFVYFIRDDGDLLVSIPITNIVKFQGTKFLYCYKRILECWVDLCARYPHPKEDSVRRTDSVATFPFMPLTPHVENVLRSSGSSSVRYP